MSAKATTLEMLKAGGVETTRLGDVVALKQFWLACRKEVEKKDKNSTDSSSPSAHDAPMSEGDKTKLASLWASKHGYANPSDMLLSDQLLGQLYREIHASPRKLSIYLVENLRTQSAIIPRKVMSVVTPRATH